MKDHETFLRAAALFARAVPEARFVCAGDGARGHALGLRQRADELGLAPRLTWTGVREDVRAVYNACDLIASTSVAEGFPNALVEALACERPCVATDVGDCALALGAEGSLVPPRDPEAQAEAWSRVHALAPAERARIGARARARVTRELSLEACTARTEEALQDALRLARA
jgi:glycosyltransferase involved in cell wall biosynthesis